VLFPSILFLPFPTNRALFLDIHTPSEHTQDGVRYDAEIQLQHFYSVTAAQAGYVSCEDCT
jgi:hypothetical protein